MSLPFCGSVAEVHPSLRRPVLPLRFSISPAGIAINVFIREISEADPLPIGTSLVDWLDCAAFLTHWFALPIESWQLH
jgi:hypothetical protein